ncbi:relaxase domain-containing protein (plasmid) [Xanthomonas phaseoli pv. phaseoli]|nr:relaxase domain-containing protein [Xanthomonas phaseoli pv. phaseoli]
MVAKFRHETSRALDPDLHTHAVVLNLTQRADGQWRALTSDGIVKSLRHLGNVYKSELARELEKAGFTLRYDRNGTFDLAHFTEHQIREFSARSQQIEAALAAKGLNRETATHAEKNQAALSTRQRKVEVNREAVRQEWQKRAGDLAIDFHSRQWEGAGRDDVDDRAKRLPPKEIEKPLEHHADKAVQFAIKSLTERNAIVKESALLEVALTHGFGRLTTRGRSGRA